jgi:two-component system chemotaxis response regulator CheY
MLGELGFEVIEASHGSEAMQRLREAERIDILLVDWNMPEMNGYDFLCRVRACSD